MANTVSQKMAEGKTLEEKKKILSDIYKGTSYSTQGGNNIKFEDFITAATESGLNLLDTAEALDRAPYVIQSTAKAKGVTPPPTPEGYKVLTAQDISSLPIEEQKTLYSASLQIMRSPEFNSLPPAEKAKIQDAFQATNSAAYLDKTSPLYEYTQQVNPTVNLGASMSNFAGKMLSSAPSPTGGNIVGDFYNIQKEGGGFGDLLKRLAPEAVKLYTVAGSGNAFLQAAGASSDAPSPTPSPQPLPSGGMTNTGVAPSMNGPIPAVETGVPGTTLDPNSVGNTALNTAGTTDYTAVAGLPSAPGSSGGFPQGDTSGTGNLASTTSTTAPTTSDYLKTLYEGYGFLNNLGVAGGSDNLDPTAAQNATDPFAPYRAQYAGQLDALMTNPSSVTSTPGYEFLQQQGEQGVLRTLAAQGRTVSGNELLALREQDQGLAHTMYNDQFNKLATLSGAGVSPAQGGLAQTAAQTQNQQTQQAGQTAADNNWGALITNPTVQNAAGNVWDWATSWL